MRLGLEIWGGCGCREDCALLTPPACVVRFRCNKEILNVCMNDVEEDNILVKVQTSPGVGGGGQILPRGRYRRMGLYETVASCVLM